MAPQKTFDPTEWVSQADAAKIRGVTRQAIARLLAKGRFTALSIAGKVLLKRSEVGEFKPKPPRLSPKDSNVCFIDTSIGLIYCCVVVYLL